MRYGHNAERVLGLPAQSVALLATLVLRGPQTAGELRTNSERLHRFADISAVEGFLNELAERASGALVAELPRAPGMRETRWMHLLSGSTSIPAAAPAASAAETAVPGPTLATLAQEVAALREDVAALRAAMAMLRDEQGVPPSSGQS